MKTSLSPDDAASVATAAYAPLNTPASSLKAVAAVLGEGLQQRYDVLSGSSLDGVTGRNSSANFGFTAFGKGLEQGNVIVAVRGTNFTSIDDWLTNARMAGARSPSGFPVHAGFNSLANSILPQVREAIRGKNISNLHIVGHSLGGAAATLLADTLKTEGKIHVYTFGAPRAGTLEHSRYLTKELGADCLFRVFHDTDPVPMVPVFPYLHTPVGKSGYLLQGCGTIVSVGAHGMELYKKNCASAWNSLATIPHRRFSLDTVDDLLAEAGQLSGGFMQMGLMRLLTKVLSLMLGGLVATLGVTALGAATVMDQIAISIMRGVQLGKYVLETVESLVRQIMRFLGLTLRAGTQITTSFLRWLLDRLFIVLSLMASRAANTVM